MNESKFYLNCKGFGKIKINYLQISRETLPQVIHKHDYKHKSNIFFWFLNKFRLITSHDKEII